MRLGILSDSHDQNERMAGALALLAAKGAEALVHCGDLTSPVVVHLCAESQLPCYYVLGNNDFDLEGLQRAIVATGGTSLEWGGLITMSGKQIGVTHGHLAQEFRRLLRAQPDYLLFGHTHQRLNRRDGPTRQINPGALHRARTWTVALLDLNSDQLRFLEVT